MNRELRTIPCPRCQRVHPGEALFCHYDGVALHGGLAGGYRGAELGREFVFPTGRRCRTYDELVRGCSEEWNAARALLRQGSLRQFLAGVGRMDLALAAQQAADEQDPDIGLDTFLAQLPLREPAGPRLDLSPRRLDIGKISIGQIRQFQVTILNQGLRLLHGNLQIEGADWIRFGAAANGTVPIKAGKQQEITLRIETAGLVAGQRYTARLTVLTNGGVAEIPVSLDVQPIPFPAAPLQGALSPRDLAARMRNCPKESGPLLENGEVQRWFAVNGWHYPMQLARASGLPAIQQFFESLGLSKSPPVSVSEQDFTFFCRSRRPVKGQVSLRTAAKKWVYGQVESDRPWLRVLTPGVGGPQQAVIEFEIAPRGLSRGPLHEGHLTIVANGGQKFIVTVRVDVRFARPLFGRRLLRHAVIGALAGFLVRSLASIPDLYVRDLSSFGSWLVIAPSGYVVEFALGMMWWGPLLGVWLLWRRSGARDVLSGIVVGMVTGLAATTTLAYLLQGLDAAFHVVLPRDFPGSAILGWTILGIILTPVVGLFGNTGQAIVQRMGKPILWMLEKARLPHFADFLAEE